MDMPKNHKSSGVSNLGPLFWLYLDPALTCNLQNLADLDLAYEQVQRKLDHTYGAESARRLRLAIAHLQDDNEQLRLLQSHDGRWIEELRSSLGQAQTRHKVVAMEADSMRDDLRLIQRKLENAEVGSAVTNVLLG